MIGQEKDKGLNVSLPVDNQNKLRRRNARRCSDIIPCAFMMPGTGRALLIVANAALVMMHRGKNGAHAQIEQAQQRGDGARHHC